ncbi:MAG: hypothetical protein M1536_00650 [Firmicutes bacterium]|nr:hypothetical protein [Bacillota bacterium]
MAKKLFIFILFAVLSLFLSGYAGSKNLDTKTETKKTPALSSGPELKTKSFSSEKSSAAYGIEKKIIQKIKADLDNDGRVETVIGGNNYGADNPKGFCVVEKKTDNKKVYINLFKDEEYVTYFEKMKVWHNSDAGSNLLLVTTREGSGDFLTPYIFKFDPESGSYKNILIYEPVKKFLDLGAGRYKIEGQNIVFSKVDPGYGEKFSSNYAAKRLSPRVEFLYSYDVKRLAFANKKVTYELPLKEAPGEYLEALRWLSKADEENVSKSKEAKVDYRRALKYLKLAEQKNNKEAFQKAIIYCRERLK